MAAALRRWQGLRRAPALASSATVRFSTRLATAGRCALAKREIVLSAGLLGGPEGRLLEVLCHEAAHLAAHLQHGRVSRLHGTEWPELVREAGHEPRRRLGASSHSDNRQGGARPRYLVIQTCPVCHTRRLAKRAVPQWRCESVWRPGCRDDSSSRVLRPRRD